jgi:AcrR family transcriptional regulator
MASARKTTPEPVSGSAHHQRGPKGERTRAKLIAAARSVFERDGYLDVRISDITAAAGVSAGSFYNYFDGKEEAFAAVVESSQEEMLHPGVSERVGDADVVTLIEESNREYVQSFRRNARLIALFEQVANIDDDFRELRRARAKDFAVRNAKLIDQLQREGRVDPEIDPFVAAHALSTMVGRMAYVVYVLGEKIPFEELVENLNRLWINALRLDDPSAPSPK